MSLSTTTVRRDGRMGNILSLSTSLVTGEGESRCCVRGWEKRSGVPLEPAGTYAAVNVVA
jgi:hypothetical protein